MKDIAAKAGVSVGTVNRVLNKSGYVSKESSKKVQAAIEELNYKPNIFARNLKLSRNLCFGVLIPDQTHDSNYWMLPTQGMIKAANELKSQKVSIKFFEFDRYSYISFSLACDKILKSKLDGLVIAPVLSNVADEFISKIPENLPYVFIDTLIPKSNCLSYIVQDSYVSGRLAAKLLDMVNHEAGTMVAVKIKPSGYFIDERIRGFRSYYKEHPTHKVIKYEAFKDKNTFDFDNVMDKIGEEINDLKGIFVTNSLTYYVSKYMKKHPEFPRVPVIGYNLIKENIEYMKEGLIEFLIHEKPEIQGYESIYKLYRNVMLKEDVPDKIMMPLEVITSEHLKYYEENFLKI